MIGCDRAGIHVVPVATDLQWPEIRHIIHDAGAKAVVVDATAAEPLVRHAIELEKIVSLRISVTGSLPGWVAEPDFLETGKAVDFREGQAFPIYYTSGTTGQPKGVVRWNQELAPLAKYLSAEYAFREGDQYLGALSMHNSGMFGVGVRMPLASGVTVHCVEDASPAALLRKLKDDNITHAYLTPYLLHSIRRYEKDKKDITPLPVLRFLLHGSAPCSVDLKDWMIRRFGPIVHEYYAGVEGGCAASSSWDWLMKPGTVGRPGPGAEIVILDETRSVLAPGFVGEIFIKVPETARFEYLNMPERTKAVYWRDYFTMGDIGFLDADGYLFIVGRDADVINMKGFNVYPEQIDQTLVKCSLVDSALSFSVPAKEIGEKIVSLIALQPGVVRSDATKSEIYNFISDKLAEFKWPEEIIFVNETPETVIGKKRRRAAQLAYLSGEWNNRQ
jgi:long-chain acyl-CoA synthetase